MATHYAILKYWEGTYKNIHISTATHPRTVNLVSNYSADIALLCDGWICKLFVLNIHEIHKKNLIEMNIKVQKKSRGNTYKIASISLDNCSRVPNMISQ